MKFCPIPENDFSNYIDTYYEECRSRFMKIQAIAGKWAFRDLLPGMSDFDTRFIVDDSMSDEDWCKMSMAVGEAHLSLCKRFPMWYRNLEHLPGVNLTWSELASESFYYPEYKQWTFYRSEKPEFMRKVLTNLENRSWDDKDEYFNLQKFCLYYGRYNRSIDPGVNLGMHANKYPLHSRIMHYFTPPLQAAMCLIDRQAYAGKFDSLEVATRKFPELKCWDAIWEILHKQYETPVWYEEPKLSELEDHLEDALKAIAEALPQATTLLPNDVEIDIPAWKQTLSGVPVDPALLFCEKSKFCRLMKGRLMFYANAPSMFDTDWLIQNELGRIRENFFGTPYRIYWKLTTGEEVGDPITIIDQLKGDILSEDEVQAIRRFHELTPGVCEAGKEKAIAEAIVEIYDFFFTALSKVGRTITKEEPAHQVA